MCMSPFDCFFLRSSRYFDEQHTSLAGVGSFFSFLTERPPADCSATSKVPALANLLAAASRIFCAAAVGACAAAGGAFPGLSP